jgi:uncharacterized membrane protein YfcA
VYSRLYDSALARYKQRNIANSYAHGYAVLSLTLAAGMNLASALALCAYWGGHWAKVALDSGKTSWVVGASVLLVLHVIYSRRRRAALDRDPNLNPPPPTPWIAGAYLIGSVVGVIVASNLMAHDR